MVGVALGPNGQAPSTVCSNAAHANAAPHNYTTNQLLKATNVQRLQAGSTSDVWSFEDMLTDIVKNYCMANSGTGCDVDLWGSTNWFRNFKLPPLSSPESGYTVPSMRNETHVYTQSYKNFTCHADDYADQDCRLDAQIISSNTVTETHTYTYTTSQRVGFVAKVKMGPYVVKIAVFGTNENFG